jgi:diacylglycerol kinase family enzyme
MVIVLNPMSGGGGAWVKWQRIKDDVLKRLPNAELFVMNGKTVLSDFIKQKVKQGEHTFVAAGGDGTVNSLLQELMRQSDTRQSRQFKLGAIGLGSSNDFHKPFDASGMVRSVPLKIDFNSAETQDIGVLSFIDGSGANQQRFWLNNASIGITANANAFFNYPDRLLKILKHSATGLAILYAALHTIFTYRNIPVEIRFGEEVWQHVYVTNLGIVKNPHFSGSFCYDSPYEKNSGQFYVHLCYDMTLMHTLNTLWHLSRAEFAGLPNTIRFHLNRLQVRAEQPFAVEYDGETIQARKAKFSIKKQWIKVCQK